MERHLINGMGALLDLIGAGIADSQLSGPVVARAVLWDGRIVSASYYRGEKKPDAITDDDIFFSVEDLVSLTKKLLSEGASFITETGTHDMVCTLEWSIASID